MTGDPEPQVPLPEGVSLRAGCSAEEKEAIVRASAGEGARPLVVGDGINDVSAMSAAAASISMGSGAPLARSAAVAQLTGDRIGCLPGAIRLGRDIRRRLRGNLYFAASYNVLGMGLAAGGWLHPVAAAAIMLVSSFLVTARALRTDRGYYRD